MGTKTKALVTNPCTTNDEDDDDDCDSNKKALLLLDDTIDAVVEIEKQLTQCQDILQQLWNECQGDEKKKGTATATVVTVSSNDNDDNNEFMDHVHQYSLYKIQWEILRSEYQNSIKNQTNNKPLTHIIDLEMMRKKNELIRRSAGHRHRHVIKKKQKKKK